MNRPKNESANLKTNYLKIKRSKNFKLKKSEHGLRDSWDILKCMHYRIPKGGEIKKGSGNLFGEIMAKNSQI